MFALLTLFVLAGGGIVLVGGLAVSALLVKVLLKVVFFPLALALVAIKLVIVVAVAAILLAVAIPLVLVLGVVVLPFFIMASIF